MQIQGFFENIRRPGQRLLAASTVFIMLSVLGMGWFQYRQIERVAENAAQGYENLLWEIYQLELHLARYQHAMRDAQAQPERKSLQEEASAQYNIFASQVLVIENGTTGDFMRENPIYQEALKASLAYFQKADPLHEHLTVPLTEEGLAALFAQSIVLHPKVHRLVLEAHQLQAHQSSGKLEEIRNFALYGAAISVFILVLSLGSGLIALSQLAVAGRRQRELESLNVESSYRASHDSLTNLVNRFEFEKHLGRALDLARLHQGQHAVLFVDLDHFKIVNDTCGHSAGDQLLRDVVGVISTCVRSTDVFGRLGGDEFGVILMHCGPKKVSEVAEQIRKAVDEFRFEYSGRHFQIGASIGWVQVHDGWANTAAVMQAADSACYMAKNSGRNRVHAYEEQSLPEQAHQVIPIAPAL